MATLGRGTLQFIRKIDFIRFIIKLDYISIDLKKVKAIVSWQELENVI